MPRFSVAFIREQIYSNVINKKIKPKMHIKISHAIIVGKKENIRVLKNGAKYFFTDLKNTNLGPIIFTKQIISQGQNIYSLISKQVKGTFSMLSIGYIKG